MNTEAIERRLYDSLLRDRAKPSRRSTHGDTVVVQVSGTTVGLAYAVAQQTGEDNDTVIERVAAKYDDARESRAEQRRHQTAASTWSGPVPATITSGAIRRCPTRRMDVRHFRSDGTCMCVPPDDETLEPHIIRGEN